MLDRILDILQAPSKKLVLLHHNADLDALGSALALYYSFPGITIGAPDSLGRTAKHLQDLSKIDIIIEPSLESYDKIIVLDTSSMSKLGIDANKFQERLVVIDHHMTSDEIKIPMYYSDPSKKSCAEIIYHIIKMGNIKIHRDTAIALVVAIISDTGHFRHADISTLETTIAILKESGIDLDHAMSSILTDPEDMSEKIAVLKGMQRLRYEKVRTWLIVGTTVNAHEALICNTLLSVGADVSFVAAQRENESRASGRVRPHAVRFGFNLGLLFQELGKELGGEGGGHPGAGGISYLGDAEALLNMCMEKACRWTEHHLRDAEIREEKYEQEHNSDDLINR